MFPSGWNSGPGFSYTYSGSMNRFIAPFLKKEEVDLLIRGNNPSEENIDKAYEIAKSIEVYLDRIYAISDVSVAYTKLKTVDAFRKAYQATLSVSNQIDVKKFLEQLTEKCLELSSYESTDLAREIEQFTRNYSPLIG
ncbi:MAG: hypothetical protein ACK5MA_10235 [Parachlamydiaceae bacterium]